MVWLVMKPWWFRSTETFFGGFFGASILNAIASSLDRRSSARWGPRKPRRRAAA
jgi:hypothetical protein